MQHVGSLDGDEDGEEKNQKHLCEHLVGFDLDLGRLGLGREKTEIPCVWNRVHEEVWFLGLGPICCCRDAEELGGPRTVVKAGRGTQGSQLNET